MKTGKKIAIVYDWFDKWGGVERVLITFSKIFPEAVFFTSYLDADKALWAKKLSVKCSFLDKFPKFIKSNRLLSLPIFPFVFESFDFSDYDLVISITSAFAKSIVTKPTTRHVCYLLTPPRYIWSHREIYLSKIPHLLVQRFDYLKDYDQVTANRPDKMIAISKTVKKRCKKYYGRDSEVVYPPFDVDHWTDIKKKIVGKTNRQKTEYYLLVSRLESYKRIDVAIRTFNHLNKELVIVGEGTQEGYLKEMAGNTVKFISGISDQRLGILYSEATALIMPQEEDFGYVALEAQFFGCPVIAFKKGGSVETVLENKTGIFFDDQTEKSLGQVVERFEKIKYNLKRNTIKIGPQNAGRFAQDVFVTNIINQISTV